MDLEAMDLAWFAHLFGVLLLAAGTGIEWTSVRLIRRAKTTEDLRRFASMGKGLEILFPVSVVLILASGVYIVEKYDAWGRDWVIATLVAFVAMSLIGGAVASRRLKAIEKAAESVGPGSLPPKLAAQTIDPVLWTTEFVLAGLFVAIVILKVVKPELEASLGIIAAAVVVAIASGLVSSRAQVAGPAEPVKLETTGTT
jgi:hypothetical protein